MHILRTFAIERVAVGMVDEGAAPPSAVPWRPDDGALSAAAAAVARLAAVGPVAPLAQHAVHSTCSVRATGLHHGQWFTVLPRLIPPGELFFVPPI